MEPTKPLQNALKTVSGSLTQLKEELRDTQAQIGQIEGQLATLEEMPVSLEDYGLRLKQIIDEKGDEHMKQLEWNLFRNAESLGAIPQNKASFSSIRSNGFLPAGMFGNGSDFLSVGAACCFFGQQVYESFMKRAKDRFGARWGNDELPSTEERFKRTDELYEQREAFLQKRDSLRAQIKEISDALAA